MADGGWGVPQVRFNSSPVLYTDGVQLGVGESQPYEAIFTFTPNLQSTPQFIEIETIKHPSVVAGDSMSVDVGIAKLFSTNFGAVSIGQTFFSPISKTLNTITTVGGYMWGTPEGGGPRESSYTDPIDGFTIDTSMITVNNFYGGLGPGDPEAGIFAINVFGAIPTPGTYQYSFKLIANPDPGQIQPNSTYQYYFDDILLNFDIVVGEQSTGGGGVGGGGTGGTPGPGTEYNSINDHYIDITIPDAPSPLPLYGDWATVIFTTEDVEGILLPPNYPAPTPDSYHENWVSGAEIFWLNGVFLDPPDPIPDDFNPHEVDNPIVGTDEPVLDFLGIGWISVNLPAYGLLEDNPTGWTLGTYPWT